MKNSDSISKYPTAGPREGSGPRSGRHPLRLFVLVSCGIALVIGGAFIVREVWPLESAAGAPGKRIAPVVARVSIRNVQFDPVTLEVRKGTIVEWSNDDLVPHTATSPLFDSGAMASGQSWRHAFTETGNFPYACTFHPNMKGVVIVK